MTDAREASQPAIARARSFEPTGVHREWLLQTLGHIEDEATSTRGDTQFAHAVLILIHDRYDRMILTREERDWLLAYTGHRP